MKFSAFIAACFLTFGLVACGGDSTDETPAMDSSATEAPAPEPAPAPAMDDSTMHDDSSSAMSEGKGEGGEGH